MEVANIIWIENEEGQEIGQIFGHPFLASIEDLGWLAAAMSTTVHALTKDWMVDSRQVIKEDDLDSVMDFCGIEPQDIGYEVYER